MEFNKCCFECKDSVILVLTFSCILNKIVKMPLKETACENFFLGITFLGSTHLHTPNGHFPLKRHSETFPIFYIKFLSTESKYLQFLRKKNLERLD